MMVAGQCFRHLCMLFLKREGYKENEDDEICHDHDGMTAATIDSAMDSLKGARSTVRLFFIGDINYGPALKKKADALGIRFEVVPYPPEQ